MRAKTPAQSALVLLSGGIDSATCAYLLKDRGFSVTGLFLDYGQAAHLAERSAAAAVSRSLDIPLKVATLNSESRFSGGELTGRNAFFVFSAALVGRGRFDLIGLGVHAGTPYYDCTPEFAALINSTLSGYTDGKTQLFTPFLAWSKRDIFDLFAKANIPINYTHSCEFSDDPCAKCSSCLDREALNASQG